MTIARWGFSSILITAALVAWICWLLPAGVGRGIGIGVGVLLVLAVAAFFRNPRRSPQGDERTMVAAADGVVADIETVDEPRFIGGRALRIGIFLSVLDVHVNRASVAGEISWVDYQPGRFLDARHPDANHANEANTLGITVDEAVAPGLRILLRQISGLIARRIVCTHGHGDRLARGELYGMIRFGSRTELWVPVDRGEVLVSVGQRVRCGETPIFRITAATEAEADG